MSKYGSCRKTLVIKCNWPHMLRANKLPPGGMAPLELEGRHACLTLAVSPPQCLDHDCRFRAVYDCEL